MYSCYFKECNGSVLIPASKSILHRALIISALKKTKTVINNIVLSNDIKATIQALESIGVKFSYKENCIVVEPGFSIKNRNINVLESGTTLRFIIPLLLLFGEKFIVDGLNKLKERPIDAYINMFLEHDIRFKYNGILPLELEGKLKPGKYFIDGTKSSQFISGLLLVLPQLDGDSEIEIIGKLESKSYVDMTIKVLKDFGINIVETLNGYYIKGKQESTLDTYFVEGDYSQASFFMVLNALGGDVAIKGLTLDSYQGDKRIVSFLETAGVTFDKEFRVVKRELRPFKFNLEDNPDLTMILAVLASNIDGESVLSGLRRLQYKESNRLQATVKMLEAVGKDVEVVEDSLIIRGSKTQHYGLIKTYNDHRIFMSALIMSFCGRLSVDAYESKDKSYPAFITDFRNVGGVFQTDLEYAREIINSCDKVIQEAFIKRMDAVKIVLDYKLKNNLEVFDKKREAELKKKLLGSNSKYQDLYEKLIDEILCLSKEYQNANYNFYGLLGLKLNYSLSKEIHEDFFSKNDIVGVYNLIEKDKDEFSLFMSSLSNSKYKGINVTTPYKEEVLPYLDYISPNAKRLNNVNTIKIHNGKLYGYNTDYYGFKYLLEKNNIEVRDKKCYILGTGGAAKTCFYVLKDFGGDVFFVSRSKKDDKTISYSDLSELKEIPILINATPVGMNDFSKSPISIEVAKKVLVAIDLNYRPTITKFLADCNSKINGYQMLEAQALKAEKIWQDGETDE